MVLFNTSAKVPVQLAADDDSGKDFDAQFTVDLQKGQWYMLRVRLIYAGFEAKLGVKYTKGSDAKA